ncbi:type II secretion system F family protein [Candidatus Hecatella orcuttiae]|jgi:flagellar protein FlaJ|uniref:type II secretion system F family protein n=1 Tax=Candidatus Hecatella orcuttiae TaxID=1935119 RepID=UPI0028682ACF|nr:type II secretion system F family protein [Candidatus Hecatella orcuttiae]
MSPSRKEGKSEKVKQVKGKGGMSAGVLEKPWYASYGFLASKIDPLLPHLKGLRSKFIKAGLPVDFRAYVSFLIFATIMSFAVTLGITLSINIFFLKTQIIYFLGVSFPFLSLPLIIAGFSAATTFLSIYLYPSFVVGVEKRKIENSLLYAVSYMSILATAGLSPERIFRALAAKPEIRGICTQARLIIRDVDIFGVDFLSALHSAIERAPSKLYADVLEGFVALIYSGGDLSEYLRTRTDELTKRQADIIRMFVGRLGMLAESAVAIIAVFPLIFIVSFSTASLLPGGFLTQPIFVYSVVYLMLPFISILFLAILRTGAPQV